MRDAKILIARDIIMLLRMKNSENAPKLDAKGFGLIDFIIIGFVFGVIVFIIISNIIAQNY